MKPLQVAKETARRFVLGRQGLWPGRRWSGKAGAAEAMRVCEFVQMDPLNPVARSHDLMLHSRVEGYKPEFFDELLYKDRQFFDYGGWLVAQPMVELPYWRAIMERRRESEWWQSFEAEHREVIREVLATLRERGPLGNRDFEGSKRMERYTYRSQKDTGQALYHLWLTGDVMTHHRVRFDRVYHLREAIAPKEHDRVVPGEEAERFLALKHVAWMGLCRPSSISTLFERKIPPSEIKDFAASLIMDGLLAEVQVEGVSGAQVAPAESIPLLEELATGGVPGTWRPVGPTTEDEATFLAPLDVVSARGRAKPLFDFDYVWEVYKPAHLRKWGYYTLPILYGDRLVGRIEPRMNRKTHTLAIETFSLDDESLGKDAAFAEALAAGVARMASFAGATSVDAEKVAFPELRKRL